MRQSNVIRFWPYNKWYMIWEGWAIKEDLLFIFKRLFENKKITLNEYNKAIKIVLNQYA